jgi:hypothetical protein
LAVRFLAPIPVGITTQAWTLLSIFVSTIAGERRELQYCCCTVYQSAASCSCFRRAASGNEAGKARRHERCRFGELVELAGLTLGLAASVPGLRSRQALQFGSASTTPLVPSP